MNNDLNHAEFGRWKTWVIQCVVSANRFGYTPLPATHLHVLMYLANTLAIFFNIEPVRGRILKRGALPFYPDVQNEIDRLAYCGVLEITKVDFGARNYLAPYYSLGIKGQEIADNLSNHSEMVSLLRLFEELVSASANRFLTYKFDIGEIDANYADTRINEGEVVDFSEWKNENYNQIVAEYMIKELASIKPNAQRDSVRLYCDYLDEALSV